MRDLNSHSLKIPRPHSVESSRHFSTRTILSFSINIPFRKAETKRDDIHQTRAFDAGQSFDAFYRLTKKLLPLFFAVSQQPRIERREQRAFDLKSGIDRLRVSQTANKEAGAYQQYDGESCLRDDERAAESRPAITSAGGFVFKR